MANLSISIVKRVHRTRREFIFERNLFAGNSYKRSEQKTRHFMITLKWFRYFDIRHLNVFCLFLLSEKNCISFYKRIIISVKLFRVYSRAKKSYRLPFRFRLLLVPQPLFLPSSAARAFSFLPQLTPNPTPYGQAVRSLRRSVFTNFISFLWGIKSSRSRPRREERGLECEWCGEGEASQFKSPLTTPYHPRLLALQSRGWAERIASPRVRSSTWGTKRGENWRCRRGCCATLGVVDCSSLDELYIEERFMSCLVKKFAIANTSFLSVDEMKFWDSAPSFWYNRYDLMRVSLAIHFVSKYVIINDKNITLVS